MLCFHDASNLDEVCKEVEGNEKLSHYTTKLETNPLAGIDEYDEKAHVSVVE